MVSKKNKNSVSYLKKGGSSWYWPFYSKPIEDKNSCLTKCEDKYPTINNEEKTTGGKSKRKIKVFVK
jgi:hypothetical protein